MYKEIVVGTALNQLRRKIPYGWDLNIYRGCQHGCAYCYASPTHSYLGSDDFAGEIFVKTNIVEALDRELASPSWPGAVINLGGVTDSYQPGEGKYRLMAEVLKVMIKYGNPVIISSKSELILRDYDLIDELSRLTYVNIAQTITTVHEGVRERLEPGASSTAKRLAVLREFKKTRASIGLHLMPIIPGLTDDKENLEVIVQEAAAIGVDYLLPGVLYFTKQTKEPLLAFLEKHFPQAGNLCRRLYTKGGAPREYKERLYGQIINPLRERYGVSSSYMKPVGDRLANK